jgi:hypothetical protein
MEPAWRIVIEKFVGCTVRTRSAGEDILPARQPLCAENLRKKKVVGKWGAPLMRGTLRAQLLAQHDAQAAAPAFGKTHANNLDFRREIGQEIVGCWMESQRRRHEIYER